MCYNICHEMTRTRVFLTKYLYKVMAHGIFILQVIYGSEDHWIAIFTGSLVLVSAFAIVIQIRWNRKILAENRDMARMQRELFIKQINDANESSFRYTSIRLSIELERERVQSVNSKEEISSDGNFRAELIAQQNPYRIFRPHGVLHLHHTKKRYTR